MYHCNQERMDTLLRQSLLPEAGVSIQYLSNQFKLLISYHSQDFAPY